MVMAVLSVAAHAQDARIDGVVKSQDGDQLTGVRVTVDGIDRETYSDEFGQFSLRGLPAGQHTLVFRFVGAESVRETVELGAETAARMDVEIDLRIVDVEEIVVTAERQLGLNEERSAHNKVSVLSAAKASELPDINAAEAIQRLPGVYIDEDRGEGRFVSIRGAGSSFNRVKLNGMSLGSPESNGLAVPLDVFPAGAVSAIQVTKTVTPANDANSIGGEITLRTPSVLDKDPGSQFALRYGTHDLGDGERIRANASINGTFGSEDQFGFLFNGAYSFRDLLAETVEASDWDLEDNVPGFEGQNVWVVDDMELRNQEVERTRTTFGAILEWRPVDSLRLHSQFVYTEFEEDEYRQRGIIQLEDGFDDYDASRPIVVTPPSGSVGTNVQTGESLPVFGSLTRVTFLGTEEREVDFQSDLTPQEFQILNVGADWRSRDWLVRADAGWSNTEERRVRRSVDFESTGVFDLEFDATGDAVRPSLTNVGAGDPGDATLFEFQDFDIFNDTRLDEVITLSTDFSRLGFLDGRLDLDFGVRATLRERELRVNDIDYNDGPTTLLMSDPRFLRESVNNGMIDGRYDFGPGVSRSGLDLLTAEADTLLSLNTVGGQDESYLAEEDVLAAYVQGTIRLGRWSLLGGVRVEQTDFSIDGFEAVEVEIDDAAGMSVFTAELLTPVSADTSYTDVFPGLHLRYDVNEQAILRASVAKTIRRPAFFNLSPEASVEISQDDSASADESRIIEFSGGNPDLEPLISWNYEISLDTYFEKIGAFGIAYFYKDLSDITISNVSEETISAANLPQNLQDAANGLLTGDFTVFTESLISEGEGTISGVEISYTKRFAGLPRPFDGLGIDANVTFTDSDLTQPVYDGLDFIGDIETALEGQADTSGNITLSYEHDKYDVRLTYAFIDGFLQDVDFEDEENLITQTESDLSFERLGAKFRYFINDGIRLTVEGNNFNDAALRRHYADRSQLREYENNGWWLEVGVEAEF